MAGDLAEWTSASGRDASGRDVSGRDASGRDASDHDRGRGVRTSFVLPAYNESGNLRPLISSIVDVVEAESMEGFRPVEIIVVDDGSTDGTRAAIRELADSYPALRGVFLARNFGQSAALAAGFDEATGDYVVTMDADGQNDPADVPMLLSRLTEGFDCVSGWRRDRDDPVTKTVPSAIQTRLAKYTGPNIHDFGCTLKAYRRDAVDEIQLRGEGHRYIPAKLYARGFSITEEPVTHHPRTHGSTKYGWSRLLRGFVDLGFNIFWNRYSMRPLHLIGGLGVITFLVGTLLGTHMLATKYVFGDALAPHLPRLILTVALVLFGVQLLMFGVLAEMLSRVLYRDETPYRIARIHDGTTGSATGSGSGTGPGSDPRAGTGAARGPRTGPATGSGTGTGAGDSTVSSDE